MMSTNGNVQRRLPWRIESADGDRGTVRYDGTVHSAKGGGDGCRWLGIEWDDAARGRHSGDVNGQKYFTVRTPGSASFVRADRGLVRHPRPILRALAVKYLGAADDDDDDDDGDGDIVGINQKGSAVVDELVLDLGGKVASSVGWAKIAKMQSVAGALKIVGFAGMRIGGCERGDKQDPEEIRKWCGAVNDLDLSRNLFGSLEEVADVCHAMEHLEILRLNYNRFVAGCVVQPSVAPSGAMCLAFRSVKVLSLIGTLFTWEQVRRVVSPAFPVLEEMHLGFNEVESLATGPEAAPDASSTNPEFPKLKVLNLESNRIASWAQVASIITACAPNVSTLALNGNEISTIPALQDMRPLTDCSKVTTLNISSNKIASWLDLHNLLLHLPHLTHLRIKSNPVLELVAPSSTSSSEKEQGGLRLDTHMELIARCKTITVLDGSQVNARLRRDAELWYLSRCHSLPIPQGSSFDATHPRYAELVAIHGAPDIPLGSASAAVPAGSIRDKMVELGFFVSSGDGAASPKVVRKRVPRSITVRALRSLVSRLLREELEGADARSLSMRVVLQKDRASAGGTAAEGRTLLALDDDLRELGFYEVHDGDSLEISVV